MTGPGVTIGCNNGREVHLSEHELARGRAQLESALATLRRTKPGVEVVDDFEGMAPMLMVTVPVLGAPREYLIDPLEIWDRLGIERHPPEWLNEYPPAAAGAWQEI